MAGADEATLAGAARRQRRATRARFGFIFIVCATGKSAAEMLALLRARLDNDPDDELRIAAAEQAKITRLRLEKLLAHEHRSPRTSSTPRSGRPAAGLARPPRVHDADGHAGDRRPSASPTPTAA